MSIYSPFTSFALILTPNTYQGNDNLAIRLCLEVVWLLQVLSDLTVVVDLAVDGKDDGVIGVGQGLSTRL
jgi:hypothetical protein